MRYTTVLLIGLMLFVVSCDKKSSDTSSGDWEPSLKAAWLGKGTFHSKYGKKMVTVQLELLDDNSYRWLFLEPKVLMFMGLEKGTWSRQGDQVHLEPTPDEPPKKLKPGQKPKVSTLMRGAPRNLQPKTVTIVGGYDKLLIKDAKLTIEFTLNQKATAKLLETGDI